MRIAPETKLNWSSAAILGVINSSFSTLVAQMLAARIGRDALVDWMTVGNIPLRDSVLTMEPTAYGVIVGILFHQWADFSWALVFFGLFGRWTARLSPRTLLLLAPLWALFTSSLEWLFLVPLFPFQQPIFTLEQPYWIGFLVHFSSAMLYPLFPRLRDWVAGVRPSPHRRFTSAWGGLMAAAFAAICALAYLGAQDQELPWHGGDATRDQAYMRRMSSHHAQGIVIAKMGEAQATDAHLRALARLMGAEQIGDNKIFAHWWASWFDTPQQVCSPEEEANMPGMLSDAELDRLRMTNGAAFDTLFVELMSRHHQGAVQMADEELKSDGDLRLRAMAQAIRHGQQGEIDLMHGIAGVPAVKAAIAHMLTAR